LSNVTADQLERGTTIHPISAVQCEWSLWTPVDPVLLAAAARLGTGIVAWSPLGGGLLTGELVALGNDDIRGRFPRLSRENLAINNDRFTPFKSLAADLHLTASQLALAWLLHQHPDVVPIPGSRTKSHIVENVASASVVLPPEILDRLDELLRLHRPEGALLLSPPQHSAS
jgi:aryl-alcohol dehydrogenase-like predicted oxidoreductase